MYLLENEYWTIENLKIWIHLWKFREIPRKSESWLYIIVKQRSKRYNKIEHLIIPFSFQSVIFVPLSLQWSDFLILISSFYCVLSKYRRISEFNEDDYLFSILFRIYFPIFNTYICYMRFHLDNRDVEGKWQFSGVIF